jgi:hypothetical protein
LLCLCVLGVSILECLFGILMWVGHLYESFFITCSCIYVCKFLRGCATLCVASLVACGFIRVFGPGLLYEGKSISKLQMDIELKQIRVLI